jgi:hypothetical protein
MAELAAPIKNCLRVAGISRPFLHFSVEMHERGGACRIWRLDSHARRAPTMKPLRIIPGRWHRRLAKSARCRLCSVNKHSRLIQVLFSTTGGGGPPALFAATR